MSENQALSADRLKLEEEVFKSVREVPDFPKPGILFKDINTLLRNDVLCNRVIQHLKDVYSVNPPDAIVAIESRGFYFGFPLALALGVPFIPIRKKGKLPGDVIEESYDLEYGSATIEVQKDVIPVGGKILIHDDVLATGGTALAAAALVKKANAEVYGYNFIIELSFLNGKEKLEASSQNIYNLAVTN